MNKRILPPILASLALTGALVGLTTAPSLANTTTTASPQQPATAASTTTTAPSPAPTAGSTSSALRATTYRTAAGHWVSVACEPSGPGAIKRNFIMHGQSWALAAPIYADPTCTKPLFTLTVGGRYTLHGLSSKATGAREGRFAIDFSQVTPLDENIAAAMTEAKCGNVTSRVGIATDILATGCAPLGQPSRAACPVQYDLLKRVGPNLYFGERPADQKGLCSPQRQATTLTLPLVVS